MKAETSRDVGAKSIDVYFDLQCSNAQGEIEGYICAFGRNYTEVADLSDKAAVVRLYPGAATQLKNTQASRGEGHEPTSTLP